MVSATYFTIKIFQFGQFYIKNQNVKFHFAVDLRMQPPTTPPPPPPAAGFCRQNYFFRKIVSPKQYFRIFMAILNY